MFEVTGANMAYELAVWDTAEATPAYRVIETGTLTDGTPYTVHWPYGGAHFYLRSTGVTGADVKINAAPVAYAGAGSAGLGTKLDTLHTDLDTTIHTDLDTTLKNAVDATTTAVALVETAADATTTAVDTLLAALESSDSAAAITPHDANTFTATRAVLIGGAGTLVAQFAADGGNTTMAVLPGVYDISVILVHTTSTATGLVALY